MSSSQLPTGERQARIRFLTTEEGGRFTSPTTGVRPQIALGKLRSSCIVESANGLDVLPLGEEVIASIRVHLAEQGSAFQALTSVELFEGSKLVATGVFLDSPRGLLPSTAR